jgi:hypothetical protein
MIFHFYSFSSPFKMTHDFSRTRNAMARLAQKIAGTRHLQRTRPTLMQTGKPRLGRISRKHRHRGNLGRRIGGVEQG